MSNSFYDFLKENGNVKETDKKKTNPVFIVIAWIILFVFNSFILEFCWNYGIKFIFNLPDITFLQSILLYLFMRILIRGLFI